MLLFSAERDRRSSAGRINLGYPMKIKKMTLRKMTKKKMTIKKITLKKMID